MRHSVVGAQVAAFSAQALIGATLTYEAVIGNLTVKAAIRGYLLWMGPLNYLTAILGVLYLIAWYFQQSPMQNFLSQCCWSRPRAGDLSPISAKAQQQELSRLYSLLYAPRVSFEPVAASSVMTSLQSGILVRSIKNLTIDLPGAEPRSVYLEVAMIGDPLDSQALFARVKNGEGVARREEPMQDIAIYWIHTSVCEWIPHKEGQGLRLRGAFNLVPQVFASLPGKISLRLRYRTPLISLLGANSYVGGEHGIAFTFSDASGVIALRNEPTPELDKSKRYSLGGQQCSIYLQPRVKR